MKKILIIVFVITLLTGCNNNKKIPIETKESIKETIDFTVESKNNNKVEYNDVSQYNKQTNSVIFSEDIIPNFGENYDFSFAYPTGTIPSNVTFLNNIWNTYKVQSPDITYELKTPSLYLNTRFNYGENNIALNDYNERFNKLINDSISLFGSYRTGDNLDIKNIDLLKDKNISIIWDLADVYVIESFKNIQLSTQSQLNTKGYIDCYIYYISKNNIHDINGIEAPIIAYIKNKINDYDLNLLFKSDSGNFVINRKKDSKKTNAMISKYLNE